MESVGIRELKERTSEILRLAREQKQEVAITYHGRGHREAHRPT